MTEYEDSVPHASYTEQNMWAMRILATLVGRIRTVALFGHGSRLDDPGMGWYW